MSEFANAFQQIDDFIRNTAKSVMGKIDHVTFKMLVDNLKVNDPEVVMDTIDQLVKENKPQVIPPIFFVSRMHTNEHVRNKARQALNKLRPEGEIEKLTAGKDVKDAVGVLIDKYGHYRSR